ncbi:hypothetical protein [Streptosporangium sp. NPDC000396]|uniref:hypothetical protein n=1 Tax=Streptosporangium sp. NPDC000396 TaxID=3366185 RepID=UPI0036CB7FCF
MTESPDEYGELLRRALSAEANSVVPSPDGLEIIRARIERRGLRGLVWWRAGASVAGAVLVAATVVMMVPQFREQVIQQVNSGEVNYTKSTPPDLSATSRPPVDDGEQAPIVPRPETSAPLPTQSKPATPSEKPTPKPTATPTPTAKPTPSPTCPTAPGEETTVEPEENPKDCKPRSTPTPTESTAHTESPCPADGCAPPDEPLPTPTEATTVTSNNG